MDKLQKLIAECGMTQTAFEAKVGLPANRISKWAGGQGEATARQALRMARELGVPVEYLVDDKQDIPSAAISTDRERQVWEMVREIGPDEAWRRLIVAAGRQPGEPPRVLEPVVIRPGDGAKRRTRKGAG